MIEVAQREPEALRLQDVTAVTPYHGLASWAT